ncbi:putative disease resistance RPP13-like protein 1 [Ananas comosus]|uniref:Disease resistance RPP13-like protein 1 n=1 Tax=Ananas comosus TaxID=4615 RepID=A0A6P5FL05_ANACO|nr:putative disease resistance RPP13-like protein 1 [Ananas comosus]XP_020097011.1 putative disease resistance RPP13-like protein 1 [Ananas comosus]
MPVLESIGLAALGWVASPLLKMLLDEGFASLGINAEKKLDEMEKTVLPVLKSVIEKAEDSAQDSAPRSEVEGWLQRLKDAYDGAEDALDLLRYDRLRRKAAAAARRSSGKRPTYNPVRSSSFFHVPKPVKWVIKGGRDMLSLQKIKLKRRLNKLKNIAGEAKELSTLLGAQPETADSRQTIAVPPQEVFGRDEDREDIIRRLKTEPAAAIRGTGSSSGIPIIAIVGRPGVGKTALAQYVFDQLRSELGDRQHFDLVMWVYASCNSNASEIMKEIIQRASIAGEPQDLGNLSSPEALRLKMNEKLNGKKFLLVIDDVWCDGEDHENSWKTLRCLSKCCCLPGSKILVTSQTDDAPRKIAAAVGAPVEHIVPLEDMEENYFSDLFIHYALPSGEINSRLRKDLEEKCKTIAKKLNKDPTAAEMVGKTIATEMARLFRSQGNLHAYLERIAQKDWSDDKTKAMMWGYRHLPAHLQRCFSYCSMYPKGYEFEALELVHLWIAQGFIKPDDQNKRMEDVGKGYLEKLVSSFYIQPHNRIHYSSGTYKIVRYYKLHELLYDLAEKVTRNYCVRIEGNRQSEIPSTIRHLCIPANKLNENKEEICKLKKLRTLIVTKGESVTSKEQVATDISNSLKKFSLKKLRVLVLELNLENLAKVISGMKHLRVLQVSSTSEFVLPESVCTLYQLQVLRIKSASSLPKRLNNLVSLRYLEANSDIISAIPDVGKLTSLQGLENFPVRKEKGYELEQLQNLNELRGCLRIANLENVESKESAIAANLKEKKHLDMLQLVWRDGEDNVNSNLDVEILEGLQLPPYLTSLMLDGYRGRSCPSWPEYQTRNIQKLALRRCGMLEELSRMDQNYPSCGSLELSHLSKLKALHALPPQLTILIIENTPSLVFVTKEDLHMSPADKRSIIEVMRKRMRKWFSHQYQESLLNDEKEMMNCIASMNDSNNNEASSAEHNKSVPAADVAITDDWERWLEIHERKMELIYNRQNEAKLLLPSTLTELWLKGCNITNRALSASLQTLTSLTRLSLEEIRTVTCLPSEDVLGKLTSLQAIILRECWAVTSLGGMGSLPCLRDLFLFGCPCLDSETTFLPSSLEIVTFASCADVDVILANADLPCLSDLMITHCRMRTALLQFGDLRSLRSLSIRHCPGLLSSVDVQELHSLEFLILHNCSNLEAVMNLPRSLKSLAIHGCPILEKESVEIDPLSGRRMLNGIPVEDSFEHAP